MNNVRTDTDDCQKRLKELGEEVSEGEEDEGDDDDDEDEDEDEA